MTYISHEPQTCVCTFISNYIIWISVGDTCVFASHLETRNKYIAILNQEPHMYHCTIDTLLSLTTRL